MIIFWLFMTAVCLLTPAVLFIFGNRFVKNPPENINPTFGYRSARSVKNTENWEFAHQYCGKLWKLCGTILSPLTLIAMIFMIGKSVSYIGLFSLAVCAVQLVIMAATLFLTENALKKYEKGK